MSHEDEERLAATDAIPGVADYRRCVDAYFREVAHGPHLPSVKREWELHDAAMDVALVAAEAVRAATHPADAGRWVTAYGEWLRLAGIHAGLAANLQVRP